MNVNGNSTVRVHYTRVPNSKTDVEKGKSDNSTEGNSSMLGQAKSERETASTPRLLAQFLGYGKSSLNYATSSLNYVRTNPGKSLVGALCVLGGTAAGARALQSATSNESGVSTDHTSNATRGREAVLLGGKNQTEQLDEIESMLRNSMENFTFGRLNVKTAKWEEGQVIDGKFVKGNNPLADGYRLGDGSLNITIDDLGGNEQAIIADRESILGAVGGGSNIKDIALQASRILQEKYPNATLINGSPEEVQENLRAQGIDLSQILDAVPKNGTMRAEGVATNELAIIADKENATLAVAAGSFKERVQQAVTLFQEKYPNANLTGATPREVMENLRKQNINPLEILQFLPKNATI